MTGTFVYAMLLLGSNLLLYHSSPQVHQISGNGVNPVALIMLVLSALFALLFMRSLKRTIGARAERWGDERRIAAASVSVLLGLALFVWTWVGWGAFEVEYYQHHGPRDVYTQYALGYLGRAWQFWSGLAFLAIAAGAWSGRGRKPEQSA